MTRQVSRDNNDDDDVSNILNRISLTKTQEKYEFIGKILFYFPSLLIQETKSTHRSENIVHKLLSLIETISLDI